MAYKPIQTREEYLKIVEEYKDYKKDDYQSMSLEEKIDFFDGIHTDHVPMFDEEGNTLWTQWDYGELTKEFIQQPEIFSLTDILKFIEMLDDTCYEPSFMDDTLKVIRSIIRFHGKEGTTFFLNHLSDIPERGKQYGLFLGLRYLIVDDTVFRNLRESIKTVDSSVQTLVLQIINGKVEGVPGLKQHSADEIELKRIKELECFT